MSLRTKLTLAFLLVSLLGAGATGAALIYGSFRAQLEQIAEKKLLLVENRAHRLEDDLELVTAELTRLSTLAEVDLADGDLEPEKRVLRYARKDSVLFQMQVLLLDDQGQLLWEEPQHGYALGQRFTTQSWFQGLRAAAGHPAVDDTGDTLRIAVPILRREEFSGALVGILDRTRPDLLTRDAPLDLSKSGSAAVLSGDGAVRFELGDSRGLTDLRNSLAGRLALAGQTGKIWDFDAQGRGWLYAFAPIPAAHWALVVREPRDELDSDLTREVLVFIALLLGGLVLALATGLGLARRITRPLAALGARAEAIARGNFGEPPDDRDGPAVRPQGPRDEIEAFSQAFTEMQRAIAQRDKEIRDARDTLEVNVEQRTRELRETQSALLVSNRFAAMGKTAAAIAHELKNALNGLGVSIDLLTQAQLPKERGDAVRVQVRSEIARLRDISDNLNLVGAAPRLSLEAVDLHRLLDQSLGLLAGSIETEGIEVERKLYGEGAPLPLRCDPQKIQTTLLNLLKNALESMAPASFGDPLDQAPPARRRHLQVTTAVEGEGVVLEISDTGAGFSAEARAHLFEPFFTTKRTGTGLGLTIAQRVTEAHGGTLRAVDSTNGGTALRLWLPREPKLGSSSPEPQPTLH